jgi:hypothetical protein
VVPVQLAAVSPHMFIPFHTLPHASTPAQVFLESQSIGSDFQSLEMVAKEAARQVGCGWVRYGLLVGGSALLPVVSWVVGWLTEGMGTCMHAPAGRPI